MNDSLKRLDDTSIQIPEPGESKRSPLKADMPSWDTPDYLQENAFPLPKDVPAPPDKEQTPQPPAKGGSGKKQPSSSKAKKDSSDKKKASGRKKEAKEEAQEGYIRRSSVLSWFNTFMIMNLPVIGWIYLLILALGKKDQRKDFARAYLVYKLVFFLVALAIIAFFLYAGMEAVDLLLQYINML